MSKKISIEQLRELVREGFEDVLEDFAAKEMPSGTSWKTKSRGWAAKNADGEVNYWYGQDEKTNRDSADKFKSSHGKKTVKELSNSTLKSYTKKAGDEVSIRSNAVKWHKDKNRPAAYKNKKYDSSIASAHQSKIDKRNRGIKNASDKLSKESVSTALDELKKSTYQSYMTKASKDRENRRKTSSDSFADATHKRDTTGANSPATNAAWNKHDKDFSKTMKRTRGISNAAKSIRNRPQESVTTTIDELSKSTESVTTELNQSTLQSYRQKAKDQIQGQTKNFLKGGKSDHSKTLKRSQGIKTATDKLNKGDYQGAGQKSSVTSPHQKKRDAFVKNTSWEERQRNNTRQRINSKKNK